MPNTAAGAVDRYFVGPAIFWMVSAFPIGVILFVGLYLFGGSGGLLFDIWWGISVAALVIVFARLVFWASRSFSGGDGVDG